jgi:DNA adenine methylase
MLLRRLGNKSRIAHLIYQHFPPHSLYIELFFGAGGMFFKKPRSTHNIVNDLDDDVFNLYRVLRLEPEALRREIEILPAHQSLMRWWKTKQETDELKKAVRFLLRSNFGYMGKPDLLRASGGHDKKRIVEAIETTLKEFGDTKFLSADFRRALKSVSANNLDNVFVYADPPYLHTTNTYKMEAKWRESDTEELFKLLASSPYKFAISEFDHPKVLELASVLGLRVIEIGERHNLKNRRMEVLVTNYDSPVESVAYLQA